MVGTSGGLGVHVPEDRGWMFSLWAHLERAALVGGTGC